MLRTLPTSLYLIALFILIAGNSVVYREVFAPAELEIMALEAGKGDATLVRMQNGAVILVDAGSDASILRALGAALPPWKRSIDLIVLTGAKSAVAGGLPSIESRYKVLHQITTARSIRLVLNETSYVDIIVSPNATTTVSIK